MWTTEIATKHLLTPHTPIIKNIVLEIIRECGDFSVERKFVTFLVHMIALQFKDIENDENFDRDAIEKLIEICMSLIIESENEPSNITLKMQVFFIENSKSFEDCLNEFKDNLDRKTKALVNEIIEGTSVKVSNKEELVAIEKKMIIDILLQMALGSPSNDKIVTEVSNALSSIMTEQDFENFSLLDKNNRLESLREIRLIVCGIVLFNKDNGIGETDDIPDVPQNLLKSLESVENLLQFTLCDVMDRVNILTTAFDGSIEISKDLKFILKDNDLEDQEVELMKDLLILNRQHEIYVRKLLGNLKVLKAKIEHHVTSYSEKLMKLHEIVQYKTAVPSVQIFPKFKEIAEDWVLLHNLSYVLCQQNQVNNYLQHLSELCQQQRFDHIVSKLLDERQVETDMTRLQNRRHLRIEKSDENEKKKISIVSAPESNSEIQYLGFCTFVLSESKILLPSVPDMGIIMWSKKLFSFYCVEAADFFMEKPENFINKIHEMMLQNIHLIVFFDIYDELKLSTKCHVVISADFKEEQKVVTTRDQEVQTDTHPIEHHIDDNYTWNLWDYRRKALELANLRRKTTSSVQTMISIEKISEDDEN